MIPLFTIQRQHEKIRREIDKAIAEVLDSGNFCCGKKVREFEEKWAELNGVKYCAMTSSGTSALEIAISCVNAYNGFFATTPLSFFATTSAIQNCRGNFPVFYDTDSNCLINPAKIRQDRTKVSFCYLDGILPVGLYGQSPDLEGFKDLRDQLNSFLILDLCQTHFTTFQGKPCATYGDISCFSFYLTKSIGSIGESGCLVTDSLDYYNLALSLRNHGRSQDGYSHEHISGNHRPNEIEAAVLLVKLKYFQEWVELRKEIAWRYYRNLSDCNFISLLSGIVDFETCPYIFPIFVKEGESDRSELKEFLLSKNIATGIHYPMIPTQKCFHRDYDEILVNLPNAVKQSQTELSLPFFPEITHDEVDKVCEEIHYFYK